MTGAAALALALAASTGVAPPLIEIASDSSCPSAELVRAALGSVGGAPPQRPAAITVHDTPNGMLLAFRWGGDGPADVRPVAASTPRDCAQRARAAAVVIASWLGALPAAPVQAPPLPPPTALGGPSRPPDAAPPSPAAIGPASSPSSSLRTERWWFGLGLGAGAGGGIAPGGRVELAHTGPSGRGVGWLVAAQATLPRSYSLADGTSRWLRPALGVAAFFAWPMGAAMLSADLGPVAAETIAWGASYPTDKTDHALSMGASAGVRLLIAAGPFRPWVELRAIEWLTAQRLRFDSAASQPATAALPRTEAFVTLGCSLPIR